MARAFPAAGPFSAVSARVDIVGSDVRILVGASRRDLGDAVLLGDPGGEVAAPHAAGVQAPEPLAHHQAAGRPVPEHDDPVATIVGVPGRHLRLRLDVGDLVRPPAALVAASYRGGEGEIGVLQRIRRPVDLLADAGVGLLEVVPGRVQPGVDEEQVLEDPDDGPGTEPGQEVVAVGGGEELVDRVPRLRLPRSRRPADDVEVVVAEDAVGADLDDAPQRLQGSRPPVDDVADQPQPVAPRIVR